MKSLVVSGLMAVSLLSCGGMAHAEDYNLYVGARGDIAFPSDSDVKGAATGQVEYGFSSGAGVVLGWQPAALDTDSGDVRVELEGSYHAFGLDRVRANNNPDDDMTATTIMGNVYYDMHTGSAFTPYIGAGIGEAFVKFPTGKGLTNTDDSDTGLAYQAMAGVSYTPESMPQTDWSIGYKYLALENPSFASAGGGVKLDPVHESAIEVGVRYHF
ncbi:MAG: outer membrane beta-barrel protein [Rhodospirillales bacterium]|nr:outer membrane beta-barrel protein [Rhodospirillales bacterium]